MPRLLVRLFAALFVLALVAAACGSGGDDDEPTAGDTSPTDDADAAGDAGDGDGSGTSAGSTGSGGDNIEIDPLEDADQITSAGEGSDPGDGELVPRVGGEITWGLTNDGTGFDTTGAIAPGSIRVIGAMVDVMVGASVDGEWAPNLAKDLVPNDDFTLWTITLRPGVQFHDGEPVNGEAVAANLQAFKNSPTAGFAFAPVQSITAVDDLTVEVAMSSPWAAFPYSLIGQAGWMVSPSTIGQNDTFVSTGPYMLESWTPGDSVRVVRNPNYWRDGAYLDAINFRVLNDQTVKRQAFEAGDIDGYISPGDEDILDFLADDEVDVWIGEAAANEYLFILNTAREPFDDLRVRQALAYGVDRQFIIDTFRSGLTTPADGFLSPSSRWYAETDYPDYDPEMAAALVAEYEAEVGPIVFEISAEPNPSVIEVIEVIISFWEDAGIEASIKEIGPGTSALTAIADDFQAFSWFQFSAIDPDGEYPFLHSSGGILNWSNLQSDAIDTGLDIGRQNVDFETRYEGYAMVQEAMAEELPMIWIDHLNGIEAAVTRPAIHGIGSPGMLPDGGESLPMIAGSFFSWTGVWIEE